jgi:hypothetical protein
MAKNVKILVVTALNIDLSDSPNQPNEVTWVIGYFTNLKELYSKFEKSSIQSYSTVCSHLKKDKYYITKESRFLTGRHFEKFTEIIIRELVTNQLYKGRKYVSLTELLAKEASNVDMQIGLGLFQKD